jgi:ABC-type nitrate/sulfonate/bicarbonate transport system substrate-binding protein
MRLLRTATIIVILLRGLTMFGSGRYAQAAESEKLNVCYSSIAATSITTWVPYEAGIYKKYGLDVRIIYVAGAQAITTLVSGDTQIVQGSGAAAALSRLSGSDAIVIGTTINVIPMSLVTTPDLTTPQDLKGKTFGVSRFGSLALSAVTGRAKAFKQFKQFKPFKPFQRREKPKRQMKEGLS